MSRAGAYGGIISSRAARQNTLVIGRRIRIEFPVPAFGYLAIAQVLSLLQFADLVVERRRMRASVGLAMVWHFNRFYSGFG